MRTYLNDKNMYLWKHDNDPEDYMIIGEFKYLSPYINCKSYSKMVNNYLYYHTYRKEH